MTKERIRRLAFRSISQLGIRYRKSPLSQMLPGVPENAPVAGDRFPWVKLQLHERGGAEQDLFDALDDTRFNLLVFGQSAPSKLADFGDLLRTHVIPERSLNQKALLAAQIPTPSCYLLRPDGHVALVGTKLDAADIAAYFARHYARMPERTMNADRLRVSPAN